METRERLRGRKQVEVGKERKERHKDGRGPNWGLMNKEVTGEKRNSLNTKKEERKKWERTRKMRHSVSVCVGRAVTRSFVYGAITGLCVCTVDH